MILTVLSSLGDDTLEASVREALQQKLGNYRFHDLTHERFAPCDGCFGCWIAHPGICKTKDNANEVMHDVITSDAVLWLTKPRFGAWDAIVKSALDKAIGLISPFFTEIDGETHHKKRYEHYPKWAVLAIVPCDCPDSERQAFRTLVERNVLNMQTYSPWVGFLEDNVPADYAKDMVEAALVYLARDDLEENHVFIDPLPPLKNAVGPNLSKRRAVLWIGSAKPRGTSASEILGNALIKRLQERQWQCETIYAVRTTKLGKQGSPKLIEAVMGASLLIIASPVYIDCLPALVLKGLADLVDSSPQGTQLPVVLPIIQCGFPETTHTRLAVEIIERAMSAAGFPWAGHLAMGAGGFIAGAGDIDSKKRFKPLQDIFDQAAEALDGGQPIPPELTTSLAIPPLNPGLYRWIGSTGWLAESLKHHAFTVLWQRPYDPAQ